MTPIAEVKEANTQQGERIEKMSTSAKPNMNQNISEPKPIATVVTSSQSSADSSEIPVPPLQRTVTVTVANWKIMATAVEEGNNYRQKSEEVTETLRLVQAEAEQVLIQK